MIDDINIFYEEHNVHKSIVICENESQLDTLAQQLYDSNHSVYIPKFYDERCALEIFTKPYYRIIMFTYKNYILFYKNIERIIFPEINLFITQLSINKSAYIQHQIADAHRRGFCDNVKCLVFN